jgi:hypothetical protein
MRSLFYLLTRAVSDTSRGVENIAITSSQAHGRCRHHHERVPGLKAVPLVIRR